MELGQELQKPSPRRRVRYMRKLQYVYRSLCVLSLVQQYCEPARDGQAAHLDGQADGGGRDDGPGRGRGHQSAEDECLRGLSDGQGNGRSEEILHLFENNVTGVTESVTRLQVCF